MDHSQTFELSESQHSFDFLLKKILEQNLANRIWEKDQSLWPGISQKSPLMLGWLDVTEYLELLPQIEEFSGEVLRLGFKHIVLLGMGGSSMSPMVFKQLIKPSKKGLPIEILDTTDPKTILSTEEKIDLSKTLFIVSSKSGTTAEVRALFDYFFDRVEKVNPENPGKNFIAITDKNSELEKIGNEKIFLKIFLNKSDIGGRFSGLSYFGIVPASLMGIDVLAFLKRSEQMMKECKLNSAQNPGIILGAALAALAIDGRDKLTYLIPSEMESFGWWLEQLLAESTGKNGKGILPVNGFPLADPNSYGKDRVFVKFAYSVSGNQDFKNLENFISRKYPLIKTDLSDDMDWGAELYKWQFATVVAASVMGLNPFDQPNVQESKTQTEDMIKNVQEGEIFYQIKPALISESIQYFSNETAENPKMLLQKFLANSQPGDYITLQAFLPEEPEVKNYLLQTETILQECFHIPVSTQFGPRYLHSTGQYHKGGAHNGYHIIFINSPVVDVQIPGRSYTFGTLKKAQAAGDMKALWQRNKNVILIDLGIDYLQGLGTMHKVVEKISRETVVV